jgi:transcriptional regulator with XRE-family HTH domain
MKKTNADRYFDGLCKDLNFRAECALLNLSEVVASQIRSRREALGWSQQQLAEKLGTKQAQISRLEDPFCTRHSLLTLAKVADVLQCQLNVNLVTPRKLHSIHSDSIAAKRSGKRTASR